MRGLPGLALALLVLSACSQAGPTFALAGATVDPTHFCAVGSRNAAYDLHAKLDARNATSKQVTIESATAQMKLTKVTGEWLESPGDVYDAGTVAVTPSTIAANGRATLDVTIRSACTSGQHNGGGSSGEYTVTVHLVTSAGTFSVTASNRHEILAA